MSYLLDILFPQKTLDYGKLETRGVVTQDPFDGILSVYRYEPPLSHLLQDIKYKFLYSYANSLCAHVSQNIIQNYPNILSYWQRHKFVILPVPLHPIRKNWRGFNQSELLGSKLASLLSLDYDNKLLLRTVFTRPQVKLSDNSRLTHFQGKNVFNLSKKPDFGNFILLDDVTTTHSTLKSCVKPLLPFCKNKPWALTIAS